MSGIGRFFGEVIKYLAGDYPEIPFKKNKIMCRAGGYAHRHNIQKSWLIFMAFGIILGNASSYIIDELICIIECVIGVKTISLMSVLGVIAVIAFLYSSVHSVIALVIGGIIFNIFVGVIINDPRDVEYLLIFAFVMPMIVWASYDNWRLGYFGDLAVADELYKEGRQQWRIFHGLKSEGGDIIEHIIVCEKGVFCVETKTYRKNKKREAEGEIRVKNDKIYSYKNGIEKMLGDDLIKQAKYNANGLLGLINEHCYKSKPNKLKCVMPILTFPGWSVNSMICDKKIVVCNPQDISDRVKNIQCTPLPVDEIDEICKFLEKATEIKLFYDIV